jgi:hypothetical protein
MYLFSYVTNPEYLLWTSTVQFKEILETEKTSNPIVQISFPSSKKNPFWKIYIQKMPKAKFENYFD